ncbi:MAG: hypothetical protein KAG53_00705 [Endozoicomonadaceae bacterium]|nr:hypothetical protein [Endozoicomonadaceae bacterium]
MSQIDNPGSTGPVIPGSQPGSTGKPNGKVDQSDADAFADLVSTKTKNEDVADKDKSEEVTREKFEEMFRRESFQQFMERSKEIVEEAKKNQE